MLQVLIFLIQKEESASLELMTMTAISVIPELGLEQEENMLTATRVERQCSMRPDNGDKHIKLMGNIVLQ